MNTDSYTGTVSEVNLEVLSPDTRLGYVGGSMKIL